MCGRARKKAWLHYGPKERPKELPPCTKTAASLSVLVNSNPWDSRTFMQLLEEVSVFRLHNEWSEKGRKIMIPLLEEIKETFDEMIRILISYQHIGLGTHRVYRSGLEFLKQDFPEQLGFCENLESLIEWDREVERRIEGRTIDGQPFFRVGSRRRARRVHWLPISHYWWDRTQFDWIEEQGSLHDFVVMAERVFMERLQIENILVEKLKYWTCPSVTWLKLFTERRERFLVSKLSKLTPFWPRFIRHLLQIRREGLEYVPAYQFFKLVNRFPREMKWLENLPSYQDLMGEDLTEDDLTEDELTEDEQVEKDLRKSRKRIRHI